MLGDNSHPVKKFGVKNISAVCLTNHIDFGNFEKKYQILDKKKLSVKKWGIPFCK